MDEFVEEQPQNYQIEQKQGENPYPVQNANIYDVPIKNNLDIKNSNEEVIDQIEDSIRLNFIRKVYGILSIQLFITFMMCLLTFINPIKNFITSNQFLLNLSFLIQIGLIVVIFVNACCGNNLFRKSPTNYIILFTYTISLSYMVSYICAFLSQKIVLLAITLTMIITLVLTVYALKTKRDFTVGKCFLWVSVGLLFELILCLFFTNLGFLYSFDLIFGIFVYSVYLIYDTQMIYAKVGNGYEIDDYILAALNVYIDIIQLFIRILQILGKLNKK